MERIMNFFTTLHTQPPGAWGAALVVVGASVVLWRLKKGPRLVDGRIPMKPKVKSSDVVIFGFGRTPGMTPSLSPGCLKLETFCRLANIPYKYNLSVVNGPTGRFPYISHEGEFVCDSNTAADYLIKKFLPALGDDRLTPRDRALGDLITRMLEQGVYWHMVRYRWIDSFPQYSSLIVFPGVPEVMRKLILKSIRSDLLKTINGQGTGDRSEVEYLADLVKDVKAVEQWLPNDGYFFGNSKLPTSYDATLYSFMLNLSVFNPEELGGKAPAEFVLYVRKSAKIQSYLKFVGGYAWPDHESVCKETKNMVSYSMEQIRKR